MKTFRLHKISIAAILIVSAFYGCSKDRIETELKSYESLDSYYDSKKPEEQEYIIDTLGECPLTGNLGTHICINKPDLQFPNGDSVYFPYTLKLIELYSPKDMIYYSILNNTSNGNFYCKGEVKITTFKNDTQLSLRTDKYYEVELMDTISSQSIRVYNEDSNNPFTWKQTTNLFSDTEYGYQAFVSNFGWISGGLPLQFEEPASISFTSATDNLETVRKYVYLPNHSCLYEITGTSALIPIGEPAKIIMIGIDGSNKLYNYYTEQTFSENTTIDVSLTEISDEGLTQLLNEL